MSERAPVDRQPPFETVPAILDSWKEIASHFGVSVRTVQLWERESGLPVHRQPGRRGRVFAYVGELEAWRGSACSTPAEKPVETQRPWLRIALSVAAVFCLILGSAALFLGARRAAGVPALHRVDGPFLVVLDEKGAELWRRRLPAAPSPMLVDGKKLDPSLIADIDGDSSPEFLYVFQRHDSPFSDQLLCYSSSGRLLWSFTPGRKVATPSQTFANLFRVRSFGLLPADKSGHRRVLVNSNQVPDYPTQLVALGDHGRIASEYWHSGHITRSLIADLDSDGTSELVLAGISNGSKTADLVVLDAAGFYGASAEENPDYQILNMPTSVERARLLFPRSNLGRTLDHYALPTYLFFQDATLRCHLDNAGGRFQGTSLEYILDSELRLLRIGTGDGALLSYKHLQASRILPADFVPDTIESLSAVRVVTPFVPRSPQIAKALR